MHTHLSFADARRLTSEMSEIVQLRATDSTAANNCDRSDHRAVHGKNSLDTDAARDLSYSEGLANAAATAGDANSFECLEALFVTFFDADTDPQRITGAKAGHIRAKPFFLGFDKWVHIKLGGEG